MVLDASPPPCVLYEDDHLLVVVKPSGWNTHAPAPHAGEGIYDWLRHREPRWASLAIIHRLDKETSGVLVFGKTPLANRSLTTQFADRAVKKRYLLLTDRAVPAAPFAVRSRLARVGDRYESGPQGDEAETRFERLGPAPEVRGATLVAGVPLTGRTHQIRVHAADRGMPILGDTLYGGAPHRRLCLHAVELAFTHPQTDQPVVFTAPPDFAADPARALRAAIIQPAETDAYRLQHGASDGAPGWYIDRLGGYLLSQAEQAAGSTQLERLGALQPLRGAYHKILSRQVRRTSPEEASPLPVLGEPAPPRFTVKENGVVYELSFSEGYSVGLFLDQRDNRRRLLSGHVAAGFSLDERARPLTVLNTFAYTCAFSVCAALAGAHTTSLDLARKYLEWGARNFTLNGLDPAEHDFIYGDAFDWLRRLARKQRQFDLVLLDPPTFSQAKGRGVFRAAKDYGKLVVAALPVLAPGGVLLASTNAAGLEAEAFQAMVDGAIAGGGRSVLQRHYVPQPPDFPLSRGEPAYLKTVWLRVA